MSDADNQTGGSGAETGPDPKRVRPGKDNAAPVVPAPGAPEDADGSAPAEGPEDVEEDERSRHSFPASDPPGGY